MTPTLLTRTVEEATLNERETFTRLVQSREAVDGKFVQRGIERPGVKIVFATIGVEVGGVAALKVPTGSYRSRIGERAKAGFLLPEKLFPFELGYVAVAPNFEGKGLAKQLVEKVVSLSDGKGLFATSSNPVMVEHILPKYGFIRVGSPWTGTRSSESIGNYTLHLLVRKATE